MLLMKQFFHVDFITIAKLSLSLVFYFYFFLVLLLLFFFCCWWRVVCCCSAVVVCTYQYVAICNFLRSSKLPAGTLP
jgi:hypothetical protein